MSLRILHILDHSLPLQSGYAFRTAALLREQRAMGWETFQLTTPKHYAPAADEEEVAGLHFFRTNVKPNWLRRAPLLGNASIVFDTARRIAGLLERVRPDILHAHSPCLTGLAALQVARRHGIPLVYEMRASWEDAAVDHGTTRAGSARYHLSRALETFVLRRADAVTTICKNLASDVLVRGVPAERITLVPNAVDIDQFELIEGPNQALRDRLGLGLGPVIGFIGSFYAYEGIDLLLRALPDLIRAYPGAKVVLVGGGPAEAQLKALTADLGLTDRVHFIGRVTHEQVPDFYSIIDVLVYPRKSMRLTELVTPLKPLEAMALGRVFAASDVGGHRELIPDHLRSYQFAAGDPRALAQAVLRLLDARASWPSLRAAGRQHVSEHCTWRISAERYREAYAGFAPDARAARRHDVSARHS